MLNHESLGKLSLRLLVGGMLVFHGIAKLRFGIGFVQDMLHAHGLPGFISYGVFVGEIVAPILILIGYKARLGALFVVFNFLVAIFLVHSSVLFQVGERGELQPELPLLYLLGALAVLFLGSGKFSLSRGNGQYD